MDFTTINSLNSYISGLKMQGLWHLRQQNGASHQDEITVDGVTFTAGTRPWPPSGPSWMQAAA